MHLSYILGANLTTDGKGKIRGQHEMTPVAATHCDLGHPLQPSANFNAPVWTTTVQDYKCTCAHTGPPSLLNS